MSSKKKKRKTVKKTEMKAKNKRLCLICEKKIDLIEPGFDMLDGGGFVKVSFGYGSKHDQIGLREPKHNDKYPIESIPIPGVENEDLITRILASYKVCSYICDECFEKKIHLFWGEEQQSSVSG